MPAADHPSSHSPWTRRELLAWTTERFAQVGIDSPRADAQHLLAHAIGCSRIDLLVDSDRVVDNEHRDRFREFVRRRLAREPVAYIEGIRGFHALDLDLHVDARVLVPRPETEHLVDWLLERVDAFAAGHDQSLADDRDDTTETVVVLDDDPVTELDDASDPVETVVVLDDEPFDPTGLGDTVVVFDDEAPLHPSDLQDIEAPPALDERSATSASPPSSADPGPISATPVTVLDVGTGSGAIALAIKHARPTWTITACDVSPDALAVARHNAKRARLDVAFVDSDLLDDVTVPPGGFVAIAANLPYIPHDDLDQLQPEVARHEPRLALDGGPDGLDVVRRLVDAVRRRRALCPGGWILLEIGIEQAHATAQALRERGFVDVETRRDLAGIERVVAGRRPLQRRDA